MRQMLACVGWESQYLRQVPESQPHCTELASVLVEAALPRLDSLESHQPSFFLGTLWWSLVDMFCPAGPQASAMSNAVMMSAHCSGTGSAEVALDFLKRGFASMGFEVMMALHSISSCVVASLASVKLCASCVCLWIAFFFFFAHVCSLRNSWLLLLPLRMWTSDVRAF